jgi:cell division protein ZapA
VQNPPRQTVSLEVGGQRLRLTAQGNERHLEALAATVNGRVETLAKGVKGAPASTLLAMAALDLADELTALRKKLDEAQRDASQRVAEADARARRAEQVAREAIAEVLTDIDRAIASDDALVAARAADGAA